MVMNYFKMLGFLTAIKGFTMDFVVIKNTRTDGKELVATFLPSCGMNMVSFKVGDIELIDQTTKDQFDERFAGLGALIGPHFHRRRKESVPKVKDESLFPHIARVKAKGVFDPFSHGIARYAPWKASATETKITATLTGKDEWHGVLLSELEGQSFTMQFTAEMLTTGLHISYSVVSATDSVLGLHYYWRLPHGKGQVTSQVQQEVIVNGVREQMPKEFEIDENQHIYFNAEAQEADHTFFPLPDPCKGIITLNTDEYTLKTTFVSPSQECSWQLYHPKGASFVCMEPISAQDPRHPNLSVSSLDVLFEVIPLLQDEIRMT